MTVATVLPKTIDRWRGLRNGKRKWTGQVLRFDGEKQKPRVIAEVYGDTAEEMRRRKHAVYVALKKLED